MKQFLLLLAAMTIFAACQTSNKNERSEKTEPTSSRSSFKLGDTADDGGGYGSSASSPVYLSPQEEVDAIKSCLEQGAMALPNEPGDGFGGNLSGNLKCSEVFLLIWDGEGSDIWDGIDRCLQQTCYDWTKSKYAPCQIMYYIPGVEHTYFGICERATGKVVQWADPWRHGVDYSEECY